MIGWVLAAGAVLVLIGVALVPLPGPGWLVVSLGLALLAAAVVAGLVTDKGSGGR